MTMPSSENPDFIELEMGDAPSANVPDSDITENVPVALPVETSTVESDLSAIAASPVSTGDAAAPGTIRSSGFVAPDARGEAFDDSPLSAEERATLAANRERSAQHRERMARIEIPAVPVAATPAVPEIDRGILPRTQMLRQLAEQSPGTLITTARAQRRATHVALQTMIDAVAGTEFANFHPSIKSNKRQFGEVMRGLNSQEFRAWAITRKDVQKTGQDWPESLEARWCMGALDGSDQLGTLGEKVLIADLLENGTIRFTGGSDVLRNKVVEAFALRCGAQILTASDLLTWFRECLADNFNALDCAGAIYVPGNTERITAFVNLVSPHMSRRVTLWDMVSGGKLEASLKQGLIQMLDEIDADYAADCEKAQERERNKVRKQNPDHTDADLDLAAARAVVLSERAGTYLRRLNDCQAYLDGLKKLIGDSTAEIKARLAAVRQVIEALCDDTTRMAANIDLEPATTVEATDLPTGPSLLELD